MLADSLIDICSLIKVLKKIKSVSGKSWPLASFQIAFFRKKRAVRWS
jgi:hypothetical protein